METAGQQRVPEPLLGRDFGPEGWTRQRALAEGAAGAKRCEIARRACESMGWKSAAGVPRLMSARAGLLKLHRAGLIQSPPPANGNANGRSGPWRERAERCAELWPGQQQVVCRIDELGSLWLRRVEGARGRAPFSTLDERNHCLAARR